MYVFKIEYTYIYGRIHTEITLQNQINFYKNSLLQLYPKSDIYILYFTN